MADNKFIHIVRVDIDPEHEAAFNEWYDQQHLPDILGCPGWLSAQRCVAMDNGPKYAAMYEVAGEWAYETPEYRKVTGFGPFTPHIKNFTRILLKPLPQH